MLSLHRSLLVAVLAPAALLLGCAATADADDVPRGPAPYEPTPPELFDNGGRDRLAQLMEGQAERPGEMILMTGGGRVDFLEGPLSSEIDWSDVPNPAVPHMLAFCEGEGEFEMLIDEMVVGTGSCVAEADLGDLASGSGTAVPTPFQNMSFRVSAPEDAVVLYGIFAGRLP